MEKYLNTLFFKKQQALQVRLELAASEFVSLRYNHLPTLQYNTRLIAYTVFYLQNRKYTDNCEIRVVSSEAFATVKFIHQYGVNFIELYHPLLCTFYTI